MVTNDLKKGARVRLANGWWATIADNARGTIRIATVEGFYTEMGSVYSHDIMLAVVNDQNVLIEHTPAQNALRKQVAAFF